MFKGNPGKPLAEETTFGWVIHGGDEYTSDGVCMYLREVNDYEKLYSLDVLEVEDRGENETSLMNCMTLKRTLREETMGGMKSVSPGFQELSYLAQTRG